MFKRFYIPTKVARRMGYDTEKPVTHVIIMDDDIMLLTEERKPNLRLLNLPEGDENENE